MKIEKKPIMEINDGYLLNVKVIPNSKTQKIEVTENEIVINLMSQPRKGEANKELIKLLSKTLKIPKSEISIIKGEKSRQKIIKIPKVNVKYEEIMSKLKK